MAAAVLPFLFAVFAGREAWVAEERTTAALSNETHALAALSRAAARENRALDGVELALAAWPRSVGGVKRPMLGDAIPYLSLSFSEHPPVVVLNHEGAVRCALYSPDGKRILSWSDDNTLRLWDVSWRGDNLFEIAANYTPMMSSREEMDRLSKRYGVKIEEPICQEGVKIPDPDWSPDGAVARRVAPRLRRI